MPVKSSVPAYLSCPLPPDHKWCLAGRLSADTLEMMLSELRQKKELHISLTTNAVVPSLVSLLSELFPHAR